MSRTSRHLTQSLSPSCGFFSNMHENRMNIGDFDDLVVSQNWDPKLTPERQTQYGRVARIIARIVRNRAR